MKTVADEASLEDPKKLVDSAKPVSIGIAWNKVARITGGRGMLVRVETGAVWITEDQSRDDVCLTAGESYCIKQNGLTLVASVAAGIARVSIEPAIGVNAGFFKRFPKLWAGHYSERACFVTSEELKAIGRRAAHERSEHMLNSGKSALTAIRARLRGLVQNASAPSAALRNGRGSAGADPMHTTS